MATRLIADSAEVSYEYNYHTGLNMALIKVSYEDHADCHGIGQG